MIGKTLSHFKITAKIGEGGMGEVYRAQDTKLGREVAIKVLPETFARDAERLARFQREAQVLASLNHPHIAAIYEVGEARAVSEEVGGELASSRPGTDTPSAPTATQAVHFLAMELVEGETLQDRLARGAVPLGEALPLALQISQALEAAHEKGIVHRDLKPANVKLTPSGQAKVLDFGLAKALAGDPDSPDSRPDLTQSPTLTAYMTAAGMLMGTAAYMSPEQARGQAADRRADIWAFGVVALEMLTGQKTFPGETATDVLGGIVHKEPEWEKLPAETPASVRALLRRCLRKDPDRRLQDIGDARIVLQDYLEDPLAAEADATAPAPARPAWQRALPWSLLGLAAAGLLVTLLWPQPPVEQRVIRAAIPAPEEMSFQLNPLYPGPAVVSPDGTKLAFTALDDEGQTRLFVRALDAAEPYALSGTEEAQYPFWSPDSRWIAFFNRSDDSLKKIDASGGPPMTLCEANDGKGGSWSSEGVIVFTPSFDTPLHQVAAAGGEATPITEFDEERRDNSHRHPRFLPDGRHFLYLARRDGDQQSSILLRSLDGDDEKLLVDTTAAADYASGHLLFVRERTLMARPFDPVRLEFTGEAFPVAEQLVVDPAAAMAAFSASENGVLAYHTGEAESEISLQWLDRGGNPEGLLGDPALHRLAVPSPDGAQAVAQIADRENGTWDLWVYEIERNLRSRFTFSPDDDIFPVWSPEGREVVFSSNRKGQFDLYRKSLVGTGEVELVFESDRDKFVTDWSADGQYLTFFQQGDETTWDLWAFPLSGEGEPRPLRQTEFTEGGGRFSPDGRWISYWSSESGRSEVYVMPFPGPGRRWQVSTDSGGYSFWRQDGRELVYVQGDGQVVAVEVDGRGETFRIGPATTLFQHVPTEIGGSRVIPTPDFQRFLSAASAEQRDDTLLHLVVNWTAELPAD